MHRYFLEVTYKGSEYSGFQKQANANTIQAEVERAFAISQRDEIELTGSSRTDAGVHALQNFFHFDYAGAIHPQCVYKMNALLPDDIVVKNIQTVEDKAHCRFDAISRTYKYCIHQSKDPFLRDRAYYFPYTLDADRLNEAAGVLAEYRDFTSFSKRNTQVKTFHCNIEKSEWVKQEDQLIYYVRANRFLRGMVRGFTGTMLQVGRNKLSVKELRQIIDSKDCSKADFSVPAKGLFLVKVEYPGRLFESEFTGF